jgi:ferric-dicitrate binding protein FerR (iron transport regulator)
VEQYGPSGYPRTAGDGPAAVDLGVSFLMPPIGDLDHPGVRAAWRQMPAATTRPAGGLAPGGSWRRDGISWTPTVALYAMAAACVDPASARQWLGWLAAHRTAIGALPEKVTADGSPASVAPLAWTAAAVLVAGDELDRGCGG